MRDNRGGMRGWLGSVASTLLQALLLSLPAPAANVVMQINTTSMGLPATNLAIKSMLPEGVGPEDILDTDGLAVGYEVRDGVYYVHGSTSLEGGESKRFAIVLRDIWLIREPEIDALEAQVYSLAAPLCTIDDGGETAGLADDTVAIIRNIRATQAQHAVPMATVVQHIAAYQQNLDNLRVVKRNIFTLENAAMAAGYKPKRLLGETESPPLPAAAAAPDKRAVIRIAVKNQSPSYVRDVAIRELLPRELTATDIIDAAGLLVGLDVQQRRLYVHKNEPAMFPGETRTYDLLVRDKWDVNAARIERLEAAAARLHAQFAKSRDTDAIVREIQSVVQNLAQIRKTPAPKTVDDKYAVFFRDQAAKLHALERKVERIRALPSGRASRGTMTPSQERRTTWLIIYGILAFLAVLASSMFFRLHSSSGAH